MSPASWRTPRCGHRAKDHCPQRNGRGADNHQSCCAAALRINRSQSRTSRSLFPHAPGARSRRDGTAAALSPRFARVRVAYRDYKLTDSRPEEWLLIEWPKGEKEPTKYWLSTLPKNISFLGLVDFAKLRWRVERVEGRGWRGFHHHATLRIAVYGLLISERGTFPPLDLLPPPRSSRNLPFPRVADPEAPPLRSERHVPNSMVYVLMWLN